MNSVDSFTVKEWQIWRQYTTYFVGDLPPADQIAATLVEGGVVACARKVGGDLYWRQGAHTRRAAPIIQAGSGGMASWKIPDAGGIDPFVLECLHESAWFETAEAKVLVAPAEFPAPYVMGFVGECVLQDAERLFRVYPVIKLYANGVLQVLFRMLSPDTDVALAQFIHEYRNAPSHLFETVTAPTEFVRAVMRKDLASLAGQARIGLRRRKQLSDEFSALIDASTSRSAGAHFAFDLAPLFIRGVTPAVSPTGATVSRAREEERGYTLSELASSIVAVVAYSLGRSHSGRRIALTQGTFWMGRPHIYIIQHAGQRTTATENEKANGPALGCILAGVVADSDAQALAFLPKSQRTFEDYAVYVTKAATLVVWAELGRQRSDRHLDANGGDLIYEQHVIAQTMDYGYMMHRRALEYALSMRTTAQAFRAQRDMIVMRCSLQDATSYGELQDLLRAGWQEMGADQLVQLTSEALAARTHALVARDSGRQGKWALLVTIVLGVLATTGLSDQVVAPLWRAFLWPLPSDRQLAGVVLWAATSGLVAATLLLAWALLTAFHRRD